MPVCLSTVLLVRGWRVFFYADEGHEPIHVHAKKGDMEPSLWRPGPCAQLKSSSPSALRHPTTSL